MLSSLALAPAVLGLLALGISAYATWENASFSERCVEARGRVVEIVRRPTGRTSGPRFRHLPVVEFTTAEGYRMSFTSPFRGDPPLAEGDEVGVLYAPDRPSEARLAATWTHWGAKVRNWAALGGVAALALSAAMALAGQTMIRRSRMTP